jgi:glyoxylase-like metal-dependent hydrolase (beta-lactamase superfamily II)
VNVAGHDIRWTALGSGITCFDADYVEHGVGCFYLMEHTGQYAVLDTGTSHSVAGLQRYLSLRHIRPEQVCYVIPTHVHLDHAGGAGAMMAAFPEAQLLVHPRGARHMADPARLVDAAREIYGDDAFRALYGDVIPVAAARIRSMQDGETVSLAGRHLEFRHTRGHAEHHFCVWDDASRGWFSGDMFGVSYPWCRFPVGDFVLPSTTPSQFDPDAYLDSLALLGSYRPQRLYLTHWGELPYTPAGAELLARQIEAYRDFATRIDAHVLQQCLTEYTLDLLRQFGAGGDQAELRGKLAFDMQLNAQGLRLWRQRSVSQASATGLSAD